MRAYRCFLLQAQKKSPGSQRNLGILRRKENDERKQPLHTHAFKFPWHHHASRHPVVFDYIYHVSREFVPFQEKFFQNSRSIRFKYTPIFSLRYCGEYATLRYGVTRLIIYHAFARLSLRDTEFTPDKLAYSVHNFDCHTSIIFLAKSPGYRTSTL